MADPVHGSITATSDGVQIDVDSPKDATGVVVKLLELDKGIKADATSPDEVTGDDLLATFTLDITNSALAVKKVDLPSVDPKKSFRHGTVAVTVRGSKEVVKVPILHELAEADQDFGSKQVELAIEVSATIDKKPQVYSSAGVAKTALRTTNNGGLVATYVMGSSKGDGYFGAAERFWQDRSDELSKGPLSLAHVWDSLSRADTPSFQGTFYETVNIVTHGTVGFVIMALGKKDGASARNAIHLKKFIKDNPVPSLRRIDPKKTKIVFRGCRIGQDPCLLRALSQAFNGAQVIACNHLMAYAFPAAAGAFTAIERLVEHRGVRRPGSLKTWSDAKKRGDVVSALKGAHSPAWTWPKDPKDGSRDPYDVVLGTPESTWSNPKKGGGVPLYFPRHHEETLPGFAVFDADKSNLEGASGIARVKQLINQIRAGTMPTNWLHELDPDDPDRAKKEAENARTEQLFKEMRYQAKILDWDPDTYDWKNQGVVSAGKNMGFKATFVGTRAELACRRMIAVDDKAPPDIDKGFADNRKRSLPVDPASTTHFTRSPAPTEPCPISGKPGCVLD